MMKRRGMTSFQNPSNNKKFKKLNLCSTLIILYKTINNFKEIPKTLTYNNKNSLNNNRISITKTNQLIKNSIILRK